MIAENVPGYTVSVLSPRADSLRAVLRRVGTVIPISPEQVDAALRRYNRSASRPTVILSSASFDIVSREFSNTVIFAVYVVGIAATVWHLANGLWLFAVDWGIVIGERAQRLTGYACIAFGLLLLAVGINAEIAFIWKGGLLGGILY